MKRILTLFAWLGWVVGYGQQYGIQWVLGDNESVIDFRNDTLTNYPIGSLMPMFLTNANICDSSGNLLYYTNGIYIAGANGNQILNSDSLSPCETEYQQICCGLDIPQGALFLPMPANARYYYLFHMAEDTLNGARPGTLYYSIIDIEGNSDSGAVVSKNVPYYKGIFREGGLTACKHGNGRDWWVIVGDEHNTYYKFLLTPYGISDTLIQTIGPTYYNGIDIAYSKFSQDGSKYVTSCDQGPILVMDFDRCSGEFSNPVTMYNPDSGAIVEFSPDGRFVYATNSGNLTQFDLSLPNPQHDSITIWQHTENNDAKMGFLQIAPNGKLYASCFNGGFYFIHAVNYPDLKGDSCMYVDTAFTTLTANSANFPNMINYRLGALVGSGCDTILSLNPSPKQRDLPLRLQPNPADKYVYVEMGNQGNYQFDLLNALGQLIATKQTRQVDIFDTENLANGVYLLRATDRLSPGAAITKKLVVQH
jgi:Secretion system C-terminal sorting domain